MQILQASLVFCRLSTGKTAFGIEYYFTPRRIPEISGGIVHVNEYLKEAAKFPGKSTLIFRR